MNCDQRIDEDKEHRDLLAAHEREDTELAEFFRVWGLTVEVHRPYTSVALKDIIVPFAQLARGGVSPKFIGDIMGFHHAELWETYEVLPAYVDRYPQPGGVMNRELRGLTFRTQKVT